MQIKFRKTTTTNDYYYDYKKPESIELTEKGTKKMPNKAKKSIIKFKIGKTVNFNESHICNVLFILTEKCFWCLCGCCVEGKYSQFYYFCFVC